MTFSKTVNYIHKLVSAPKKSILKFNALSNIHIFKFAFGCLFSHHTLFKTHKCILRQPNFQNFPWGMPPLSPTGSHRWRTFSSSRRWIAPPPPPAEKPAYRPARSYWKIKLKKDGSFTEITETSTESLVKESLRTCVWKYDNWVIHSPIPPLLIRQIVAYY